MIRYRMALFGGFELRDQGGEIIHLPGTQAALLLAILALNSGQPVSRLKLIKYLWEDRDEPQGRSSLRQTLWTIRRALEPNSDDVILTSGGTLALSKDAVEVDVDRFERLVAAGTPEDLDRATKLYQGDLLDGIAARCPLLDDHIRFERGRLKTTVVKALTALVGIQRNKGAIDPAIRTAERALSIDPLSEEAHRALMDLFVDQGQKGLALKQYDLCREFLRSELDVDPDPETTALYQRIKADQQDRAPSTSRPKPPASPSKTHPLASRAGLAVALAAIVAVLTGTGLWFYHWQSSEPATLVEASALPPSDKPSIAVLPFTNMSGDPEQDYFADGITEDLITDLSKISGLFVIARNSAFTYKGKAVKAEQVARELGVRYVLEGSVRRDGDRVRINAQLIDATTGVHLWAERYDGTLPDIFALQDKVTRKIVTALAVNLTVDETARQAQQQTDNPEAYDAFLQGWAHFRQFNRREFAKALGYFERAVELDPNYGRAHAAIAGTYIFAMDMGWQFRLRWCHAKSLAEEHLQIAMKHRAALAHRFASVLRTGLGRHEEAVAEAERAVTLDPNDAENYDALGSALIWAGRPEKAIQVYETAMQLDPHYPARYLQYYGLAYFGIGQYEKAAILIERARKRNPEIAVWTLMAAYGHLGRGEDAAAVLKEFYEIRGWSPSRRLDVERLINVFSYKERADAERLGTGLVKTGMCCEDKLQRVLDNLRVVSTLFGDVEIPESYELPVGVTVLSEAEIRDQIVGSTLNRGKNWSEYILADGTLSGLSGDLRYCDYWAVSGPVMCFGIDSQSYCATFAREGSRLSPFNMDGTPRPPRELLPGNPENL